MVNSEKFESIVEKGFGYEPARDGRLYVVEHLTTDTHFLINPKVTYCDYGVTIRQLRNAQVLTSELDVLTTFDISPVILIKVVELIINISCASKLWQPA